MKLLALTFGFGVLSSSIPVFNMEAFLVVAYARASSSDALALALVGSVGQNLGKLVWYYASKGALDVPLVRRQVDKPKRQAQIERWRRQVEGRPWRSGGLNFLAAAVGFPPFFVMAVLAGMLHMNVVVFVVTGIVGRTLFFLALLLGVGLVVR